MVLFCKILSRSRDIQVKGTLSDDVISTYSVKTNQKIKNISGYIEAL